MTTRSASYSQKYTEITADYRRPEGVSVSPSSMSVMVDRTGEPVERSDSDHFGFSVRNVNSAQNQFPVITQAERMVDRTGKPVEEMIAEERESPSAQIRTLFNDQRRTIIAECCEKVSHHELLAAQAEQERKILQGELWRQQQDFREVHQQNLTEMKELQKFQNCAYTFEPPASCQQVMCLLFPAFGGKLPVFIRPRRTTSRLHTRLCWRPATCGLPGADSACKVSAVAGRLVRQES